MTTAIQTESTWPWFVSLILDSGLNETFLLVSQAPLVFVTVCNSQTRKATDSRMLAQISDIVRRTASETYNCPLEDDRSYFIPLSQNSTTLSAAKAYHDHNQNGNAVSSPCTFADSKSIIKDSTRILSSSGKSPIPENVSETGVSGGFAFLPYEFASFQIDEWRAVYGICTADFKVHPVQVNGRIPTDRLTHALDVVFQTDAGQSPPTPKSPRLERYRVLLLNGPFSTLRIAVEHAKSWSREGPTADIGQALAQKLNYTSYGPDATRVGGSS